MAGRMAPGRERQRGAVTEERIPMILKRKRQIYQKASELLNRVNEGGVFFYLGLLLFQIGMIVYFNMTDIRHSLDSDFSNTVYHFREVIRNGTLNLRSWNHTTSLELDAVFLFALPITYLVHDLFTAVGIANLVFVFLYIAAISGILQCCHISTRNILVVLCLVLTPYSFGMLEYFNMMFFGGACYSLKTLVPLLFLWLLLLLEKQDMPRWEKGMAAAVFFFFLFFLFITSFSTGIYVMLCGVVPLFCCMLWKAWRAGTWKGIYNRKQTILLVAAVLMFTAGYLLHCRFYGLASRTTMNLTRIENYAINFRACVRGIFDLFGATVSDEVKALSVRGIWYCLKMGFVAMLVGNWLLHLKTWFGEGCRGDMKDFLASLPLFNFLILLLADSRYTTNPHIEYRYYLIGAIPLILLLGIRLDEWEKKSCRALQKRVFHIAVWAALLFLMAGNNKSVLERWDRTSYAVELCDYFNTLDIESVFFVDDPNTSNICKGIDGNHKYGTFLSETQRLDLSICSYLDSASGSFYGAGNALAVFVHTVPKDYMPEEIASHYRKVGTIQWFDIYVSDQVWFP